MKGKVSGLQVNTAQMVIDENFAADTLLGLSSIPKFLLPKYFYDDRGSAIFRQITKMPGYYLTRCEQEILTEYACEIAAKIIGSGSEIRLIEPGSGDGSKTIILLKALAAAGRKIKFIPVDISGSSNEMLKNSLQAVLPGIEVNPLTGDYFHMPVNANHSLKEMTAVLFLGSNIGNLNNSEMYLFLRNISELTIAGDKLLIGFDLKKSPGLIMSAYDDPHGLTRNFNLNHLLRINGELHGEFDISSFEHHTDYNPVTGELKSYLLSSKEQAVYIGALDESFKFSQWEPVFMEMSRKFDIGTIENLALAHDFRVIKNFTDRRSWFAESLWARV